MRHFDYVVIGAGPAGGAAAMELVRYSDRPSVALIGEEPSAPYERPPLSKATLAAQSGDCHPPLLFGGLADLLKAGVTPFIPARAVHINRAARVVELESGSRMQYDKVLFATGSAPKRLTVPGETLEGIHYLRTYAQAVALSAELRPKRRVVVVGGGFIGLEVGATARKAGCEVTVVEAGRRLLARGVPECISIAVARKFELEGVDLLFEKTVRAFHGSQRVNAVELNDGMLIEADCVLIGIGAVPNTSLAEEAGLEVRDGILTDVLGRTADPYCFAVGDAAHRHQGLSSHPSYTRRSEAWEPAIEHAIATAKVMHGQAGGSIGVPWIWSDQFDWNIQIAGYGELADATVVRPGATADTVIVFQLWKQRLIGAIALNDGRNMTLIRRSLQRGESLSQDRLANRDIPLRQALSGY